MTPLTKALYGWLLAAILTEVAGIEGPGVTVFRMFVATLILIAELIGDS